MAKARNRAWRHLEQKRRVWWFKIGIPAKARPRFDNKTHFRANLRTSDIQIAMQRRDELERDAREMFENAVTDAKIKPAERGRSWRDTIQNWETTDPEIDRDFLVGLAQDEAEAIKDPRERQAFSNAFAGKVAVDEHLEGYLKTINLADKTTNERRGLIARFARWCEHEGLKLPDIDRRTAGRYVAEQIEPMHRRTGKKHLTALTGFWEHLNRRGHVQRFDKRDNPWRDQMEPERRKKVTREDGLDDERAFTDAEIETLLEGKPTNGGKDDTALHDMIRIAALSGMRIAEITGLRVGECIDGVFAVMDSKTVAGRRKVPIHPDLQKIVQRRIQGRNDLSAPLFAEMADMKAAGDTMGKRFKRYRESQGVDDKRAGKRRSLVNFHSFRRWFITKAEEASIPETTVAAVVGHEEGRKNITFGGYSDEPGMERMRECVEAVRLPTFT